MADSKKEVMVKFRLKTIDIIEEKLECPLIPLTDIKMFSFIINTNHKVDKESKIVIVIIDVSIAPNDDNRTLAYIKVGCTYEIDNMEELIIEKTNKVKLPTEFSNVINSVSISTVRGILYFLYKGTYLQGALLPLVDPTFGKSPKMVS